MKYFGFVYIWYDRKRKMYYIGSHMGTVDDGYVCSNKRMKNAFAKRPNDFRRRIVYYHHTDDHKSLFEKEQYWLNFIQDDELCYKYYNVKKAASGMDSASATKINLKRIANGQIPFLGKRHSEETKKQMSESAKNVDHYWLNGRVMSEEGRKKCSKASKGRKVSEETKKKISEAQSTKVGELNQFYGHKHSEETKKRISELAKQRSLRKKEGNK